MLFGGMGLRLIKPERKKFAVMFTDIVGFSSRMERDETDAMSILLKTKDILSEQLNKYVGSLVKVMGDGTLSVFSSPVSAVRCARSVQDILRRADFQLRIGIHWGDVLLLGNDIFGDTVNIASRLEEIAAPGGICVSKELLNDYGSGRRPSAEALGLHRLKGLGRLIEIYVITGIGKRTHPVLASGKIDGVSKPEKKDKIPSVAVTILENLGSDSDAFYSYGISSDLVSDLSRAGNIAVAPLSDVLRIQEAGGSINELTGRLGVRYIVKGSLWKQESVFRLNIELLDTEEKRLIWADNWQDDWYELASIKGKLADGLLKALGIEPGMFPGVTQNMTDRTGAYELYLRGRYIYRKRSSSEELDLARQALEKSIILDPELVQARNLLGGTYRDAGEFDRGMSIMEESLAIAKRTGDKIGQLTALNGIGIALWKLSQLKKAQKAFRQVLSIARTIYDRDGEARALNNLGLVKWNQGNFEEALHSFEDSLAISVELAACLQKSSTLCNIGLVHASQGDDEAALDYYRRSLDLQISSGNLDAQAHVLINMGSAYFRSGAIEKAVSIAERSLQICLELGDRPGQCKVLNNIGNIMLHLGLTEKAESRYREAIGIAEDQGDQFMQGIILSGMGLLQMELDCPAKALVFYGRSLEICRVMEDAEGESELLLQLGEAYLNLNRLSEAGEHLRRSLSILENIGAMKIEPQVRGLLAQAILREDCSPEAEAEALELLKRAEDELQTQSIKERMDILWILAQAYRLLATSATRESLNSASRNQWSDQHRRLTERAYRDLMQAADRIQDHSNRESYLNRIFSHGEIIRTFEEFSQ